MTAATSAWQRLTAWLGGLSGKAADVLPVRVGGTDYSPTRSTPAAVLGFAHTVGEFGIVLMIGGNIPEKTRVVSVQIYDHVEALEYTQAHWLSGGMVLFSFIVLMALYTFNPAKRKTR